VNEARIMALEDRVRDVENEVKVLKNEIKTVLLNIQEHVLTYYMSPFKPEAGPGLAAAPTQNEETIDQGPGKSGSSGSSPKPVNRVDGPPETSGGSDVESTVVQPKAPKGPTTSRAGGPGSGGAASANGAMPDLQSLLGMVNSTNGVSVDPSAASGIEDDWLSSLQGEVDLAQLAGLANWANGAVKIMGGKRAKAVLDVYAMTGILPQNVAKVLQVFVPFDGSQPPSSSDVPMRELLQSLLQLDKVLGRQVEPTAVALSLLLDGER
jgi:hypothetical protein